MLSCWLPGLNNGDSMVLVIRGFGGGRREKRLVSWHEQLLGGRDQKLRRNECTSVTCNFRHVAASCLLHVTFPKHCLIPGDWHTSTLGMPALNGKFSPSPFTSSVGALQAARVLGVLYHCQQICSVLLSCLAARSALQESGAWLKFLDRSGFNHNEVGSPQATGFLNSRRRRFLACVSWKGSKC